MLVARI